jgi:general secretion pathway protein B
MSFILDALRKSEHERQRQSGPGLAEVAVAAPRTRTNVWATAAVVLLVANLLAVGVLMIRRATAPASVAAEPTPALPERLPAPSAGAMPSSVTATAPPRVESTGPAAAEPSSPATAAGVPPMLQPADASVIPAATRNPLELEVAEGALPGDPVLAERAASVPSGPPAVTEYSTRPGSVVYETAPGAGGEVAERLPELPTIDDVALQGGVPEMHVDLHVYASNPQERFIFVNKRKYREGDTLQEGPRVEEITRNGVVLNQQGRRFILPRQ